MKIVHVIDSLATGGAEKVVVNLAEYGIKQDHEILIVILKKVEGLPDSLAREQNIPIVSVGNSYFDPRIFIRLKKITKDADIVHVHLFPALYWGALLSKPKVFTEHSSLNSRMKKRKYSLLEKWVYQQYDRIIAISEGVASAIKDHLSFIGAKTPVVRASNGTTDEFFTLERKLVANPQRVVIIGSLKPVKQHFLAIRAISYLEDVYLHIAGDGDLRPELEALVQNLGIRERVRFLGNVQDVPALLSQMDLLLSTSKYEGLSTVAIEAQASGIPVVGPDVAGIRDVVVDGKTGILYKGEDPKIIAQAIEKAFSEQLYTELAIASRKHARKYSIENSFREQESVYQSVIDS